MELTGVILQVVQFLTRIRPKGLGPACPDKRVVGMGEHVLLGGRGIDVEAEGLGPLGPMAFGEVEGLGRPLSPAGHPLLRVLVSNVEVAFGPEGLARIGKTVPGHAGEDVIAGGIDLA